MRVGNMCPMPSDAAPSAARVDEALLERAVRPANAFEEVVARLLRAIKLGVVTPGARLPSERELAVRFDVSRDTVREAIRALQQAGFVASRRGRYGGSFVLAPGNATDRPAPRALEDRRAELDDVLRVRQVLEPGAAEVAAQRVDVIGPDHAAADLLTHLAAVADADADGYRRLDSRLHLAIAEAAGSQSLVASVADVRMRVNALLDEIPLLTHNIDHAAVQHDEVVHAVLAGRPRRAREAMAEHVAGTEALLRGFLSD